MVNLIQIAPSTSITRTRAVLTSSIGNLNALTWTAWRSREITTHQLHERLPSCSKNVIVQLTQGLVSAKQMSKSSCGWHASLSLSIWIRSGSPQRITMIKRWHARQDSSGYPSTVSFGRSLYTRYNSLILTCKTPCISSAGWRRKLAGSSAMWSTQSGHMSFRITCTCRSHSNSI